MNALYVLVFVAAIVILAEALNKIERTNPRCRGLTPRLRLAEWLKAVAWSLLATGSALYMGAVLFGGSVRADWSEWAGPLVLIGFAVLVVRTRVKEG